jgi:hypothetical protein
MPGNRIAVTQGATQDSFLSANLAFETWALPATIGGRPGS